jgi:hypothetical protein
MSEVAEVLGRQERSARLQRATADYVAATKGRIGFQGDDRVVVITGHPVNHVLHLLLTVCTGGLWVVVWILVSAFGGEASRTLTVDEHGSVRGRAERTVTTGRLRLPRVAGAGLVLLALLLHPLGVPGAAALVGLVVLGVGGVALVLTDIARYGIGRAVPLSELRGR